MWMSASGASAGATSRRLVKRQPRPGDLDDDRRAVPRHAQRYRRAGGQVDVRPIARARHRGGEHLRAEAPQGDAGVIAAGERRSGGQLAAAAIEDAHVRGAQRERARGAVDERAEEHLAALERPGARPAPPGDARGTPRAVPAPQPALPASTARATARAQTERPDVPAATQAPA